MGTFQCRLGEQYSVVSDNPDRVAVDPCETTDQCVAVALLELMEARAVNDSGDDLSDIVGRPVVGGYDSHQILWVMGRLLGLRGVEPVLGVDVQILDHAAHHPQRLWLVLGEVVGHP